MDDSCTLPTTTGISLNWRPGGGALGVQTGYTFFYDRYDRSSSNSTNNPAGLDNLRHMPKLKIDWKFLPKTSVYLGAQAQFTQYPNSAPFVDPLTGTTQAANEDSITIAANLGATGSITSKLSALVEVGYGDNFGGNSDFRSVIGKTELKYALKETLKFKLGFQRSIQPVSFFGNTVSNIINSGYSQQFGGKTQLGIDFSVNLSSFGESDPANPSNRSDQTYSVGVTIDQTITEWLQISLINKLDVRKSSSSGSTIGDPEYFKNDIFLRLTARY